ncbi:MAG: hypothetical protein KF871_11290 [Hydrogenophaga sp.]|uniref:hypothetical protein n=1 Tax=Hydrogenophaga sp. TaxID=1904254 RepID=UPI001D857F7F|nr:hypothetical protein [Hydrogenophaga sp.]MBX3610468.1 hypothetical protein [Hydrogenophaga sp.]
MTPLPTTIASIKRFVPAATRITLAASAAWALVGQPALAGPASEAFRTCVAESTTGKDRKDVARWFLVSMAAHPEFAGLSTITDAERDQAMQRVGVLFTRLLSEDCAAQAKAAVKLEGSAGMQAAFGTLGELAMKELMTNQNVTRTLGSFERFADRKKIDSALADR